jgi:hypothetical protein
MLTPDALWSTDVPSFGRAFAIFYQNIPEGHSGAWYGFGLFYGYFGLLGIAGLGGLGFFLGAVVVRLAQAGAMASPLAAFFLHLFCLFLFIDGNVDLEVAFFISNTTLVGALLVCFVVAGRILRSSTASQARVGHRPASSPGT